MSYFRPHTVDEALEILKDHGKDLKVIAGCTDVAVAKVEKILDKNSFIDISYIDSLNSIEYKEDYVVMGAMVTHSQVIESPLLQEKASILVQACKTVGSPQIRNRGTVGGNVSHASPAGDTIPALLTLNAQFCLQSVDGERWVNSWEFFKGPGKTVRRESELLTKIRFKPLEEGYFCLYQKLGQRKALAISKASLAFVARVDEGKVYDVRIALGSVAPTVVRGFNTEKFLDGKDLEEDVVSKASQMIMDEVSPIDDIRSTATYRKRMIGVLLERALRMCRG